MVEGVLFVHYHVFVVALDFVLLEQIVDEARIDIGQFTSIPSTLRYLLHGEAPSLYLLNHVAVFRRLLIGLVLVGGGVDVCGRFAAVRK